MIMLTRSHSIFLNRLAAATKAAVQCCSIQHALLFCLFLSSVLWAAAQLAMPDSVLTGSVKHYHVTANQSPGSTYIWLIDEVIQTGSVTNEIDITWTTKGTYMLVVQELNAGGCYGPRRSGFVIVNNGYIGDLCILNTVNYLNPFYKGTVVFSILATNLGRENASGVSITFLLPSGFSYISSTSSKGVYEAESGEWIIGDMNKGESELLLVTAKVNSTGIYATTATISGTEEDSNLANNVSSNLIQPIDFFIPDGFSPNGDGINDYFVIRGLINYELNTLVIYNRWGNKVYEASPYLNNWDGTSTTGLRINGNMLPTGTYFYLLDLKNDMEIHKGSIYLNR